MIVISRDRKRISLEERGSPSSPEIMLVIHGFGPKRSRNSYACLSVRESRLLAWSLLRMAEEMGASSDKAK